MELYINNYEDPNYDENIIHTGDEIKALMTQIETILFTNKGEVIGNHDFGASLEDMIYDFQWNEQQIVSEINHQLEDYCPLADKYNVQVSVEFTKGEIRDVAMLNIVIDSKYTVGVLIE
tara:strand:- start:60 stop:416 length:357 start_codon:yes stop_codon:yes gene_type:complete